MITAYRGEIEQMARSFSDTPEILTFWQNTLQNEYDSRGIHPTHPQAREALDFSLVTLLKQFPQVNSKAIDLAYDCCFNYHLPPSREVIAALKIENQTQRRKVVLLILESLI